MHLQLSGDPDSYAGAYTMDSPCGLPKAWVPWLVGLVYLAYFAVSTAALVCLFQYEDESWPLEFALITFFVITGLHFLHIFLVFAMGKKYVHPLGVRAPRPLVVLGDLALAGALGAAATSYDLTNDRTAARVATVIGMMVQIGCLLEVIAFIHRGDVGPGCQAGSR